jgi:hypothetical protein
MYSSDNGHRRNFIARPNGGLTPRDGQFPGQLIGAFRNNRVVDATADVRRSAAAIAEMDHLPRRPWWTCRSCQELWPCIPAREALGEQMRTSALAIFMTTKLNEAVRDMPGAAPGALWRRFLAWTKPAGSEGRLVP